MLRHLNTRSKGKLLGMIAGLLLLVVLTGTPEFLSPNGPADKFAEFTSQITWEESPQKFKNEPITPLPLVIGLKPEQVELGRRLFFDPNLSSDGSTSCASCHSPTLGGADALVHSVGVKNIEGSINAPTVYNSALNFAQFWDGRAATLEEQALGPIQNPKEMGSSLDDVVGKLSSDESYFSQFLRSFGSGPSPETIAAAIAVYERSLLSANSPFDRYLQGDDSAVDAQVLEGYKRFKSLGCIACHQGSNVGGNMFQKFGVMGDYFADRGNITEADNGRFNITHKEADRYVFKVPSLRNVTQTAPYFHDGSARTLDQAVRVMAQYQLGRVIEEGDVNLIIEFLHSLKGDQPK